MKDKDIIEVKVDFGLTVALPNYENFKPTAGVVVHVVDGDYEAAFEKAWDVATDEVMKVKNIFKEAYGKKRGL